MRRTLSIFTVLLAGCGRGGEADRAAAPPPPAAPAAHAAPTPRDEAPREERSVHHLTLRSGQRVRITEVAIPDAGHVESGRLIIAYEGGRRRPAVAVDGSGYGIAPQWRLRRDIPPDPLLQVDAGWTGMGTECAWTTLVRLGPSGPHRAAELWLSTSDRDAHEPPTIDYSARLTPTRDGFVATYTGTRRARVIYRLKGADYVARRPFHHDDC